MATPIEETTGRTGLRADVLWRLAGGFLVALGFVVLALPGVRTIGHADFWTHLAAGRWMAEHQQVMRADPFSFTVADKPWVNDTWLYDRALFALWNLAGPRGVVLAHVALVLVAFALLLWAVRRRQPVGGFSTFYALWLGSWILAPRFQAEPILVGLFFMAFFISILSRWGGKWLTGLLLAPAQVLWTNGHSSFLVGPLLVLLFGLEAWMESRAAVTGPERGPAARSLAIRYGGLAAGLLVLSLLNPYGLSLHRQVFHVLSSPPVPFVEEWISPFSGQFTGAGVKQIITLALLLAATGLITERGKLPPAFTVLAMVGTILMVRSVFYIEIFALFLFPFLCLSCFSSGLFLQERLRLWKGRLPEWLLPAGCVLALLLATSSAGVVVGNHYFRASGSACRFGWGVATDVFPESAARVLEHPAFAAHTVNLVPDGGYLAWRFPQRRVFIDSRAGLYDAELQRQLALALSVQREGWDRIEARWAPGAILLNCGVGGFDQVTRRPGMDMMLMPLLTSGRWALCYFDGTTVILVRADAAHQPLIANAQIQSMGLQLVEESRRSYESALNEGHRPPLPPRLIGAGQFFLALGKFSEARLMYSLLVRGAPEMVTAWLGLGISQLYLGQNQEAVASLELAVKRMPKNPFAWFYLSRAYAAAGFPVKAEEATDRMGRLNPALAARLMKSGNGASSTR